MKPGAVFNPNVHGARGLFSAMVFVYHVYHSKLPTFAAVQGSLLEIWLLDSMKFGVELFFGISGLVIVGALTRAPSAAAFAWDRIARIFPALWASLLVFTAMRYWGGLPLPSFGLWAANFLAPPPFFSVPMVHPAAWSLGYEFTFYMLCALLWAVRGPNVRSWRWIAVITGTLLVILFPRGILMAAGVIIAAKLPRPAWMGRLARYPGVMLLIFLMAWRALDMAAHGKMRLMSPLHADFLEWLNLAPLIYITGVIGGIGLLGVEQGRGFTSHILRMRLMQWLGTISYSFYLWHPACMAIVKLAMHKSGLVEMIGPWSQIVFFILALGPSLVVSHVSQIVLEQRVTRWLRKLGHKRPSPPLAGAPAAVAGERDIA
ncbi:acyltransferase family protein [Sphingobium boeckii]|uniref:Peptidoglycan/LPS O-acetylase OafA/YrhL n=1 Tax=Sphingobium boeckii TaxID=1082345 RepID=A0A7W9EF72_9SPHN|nr:acyltransferase [Sphingobium boeckii]MBB5685760.1 peptidoglycan/LPS O-acetylase OafA/YrhL [Sphingobium boeckii]